MNTFSLIGVDKNILKQCCRKEQKGFARIANLSLINLILATVGITYLFILTFNSVGIALVAGLFWAAVFGNLNRFVLLTVSGRKINFVIFLSIIIKLFVLSFFAFLAAFPFQLLLYNSYLNKEIAIYKTHKEQEIRKDLDLIHNAETTYITKKIADYKNELSQKETLINKQLIQADTTNNEILKKEILNNTAILKEELQRKTNNYIPLIESLTHDLSEVENNKEHELSYYKTMLANSVALIERGHILMTHKKKAFNIITALSILFFWYPLLYKQRAAANMSYSKLLANMQYDVVSQQHAYFTKNYKEVLLQTTGQHHEYPKEEAPNLPKYNLDN